MPKYSFTPKIVERFNDRFTINDRGCWLWSNTLNYKGYGVLSSMSAHRWSYMHHIGPIPDGLEIDHLCRVRNCVNPEHLEPVTRHENQMRGLRNQNGGKTHCSKGHEFDLHRIDKRTGHPWRQCSICVADTRREWRARRKALGLPYK